jgi:3-oxoacyl-[acyl-carrier protein] reductase
VSTPAIGAEDTSRVGAGRLANRVALVTGAARGMGFATSRQFLEEGAVVFMNDISTELIETARERLPEPIRRRAHNARADVLDSGQIDEIVKRAVSEFGGVDVLVNNVGGRGTPPRLEGTAEDAEREIDLCLTSAFVCTRAALPSMLARGGGAIVSVSSSAGQYPADLAGVPYCAGKAGVLAFTRAVATEYASQGIRCNCVLPGNTLTEHGRKDWDALPESEQRRISSMIPMGRLAYPEDIARVITFLVSAEAGYVNGVSIDVNGGHHMR